MPAGASALRQSRALEEESETLFELARSKREQSRQYRRASEHERDLAGLLRHLDVLGWRVLEDRRWPGSRSANIDLVLVGSGGVVVVDAKCWAELSVVNGSVRRGEACADDEVESLVALSGALADVLAPLGLVATSISAVMAFDRHAVDARLGAVTLLHQDRLVPWLAGLRQRLTREQVDAVVGVLDEACPELGEEAPRLRFWSRPTPRRTEESEPPALVDVDELTSSLMDAALAGPIEEWMTFLHPDQNRLVRVDWNGTARVRGPAGTGKTVVGLHRAAHLAQRLPDPVLFVSYVRTLPVVLSALARRISPSAAEHIDFVGVHALAHRVLDAAGRRLEVDPRRASAAFRRAWKGSGVAETLGSIDDRAAYWQEEVDHVIKARGITDFNAYRDLARIGRRTRLRSEDREAVWELYVAYQQELELAGIADFNDLLLQARIAVRDLPDLARYGAVVVDEVQDLNLAAVAFLATIADQHSARLLLIGDGQQSVYPGGFRLSEAGISVAGRAAVLKHNYRNTVEILEVARQLVSADSFDDLEDIPEAGTRELVCTRNGHVPIQARAASRADLEVALVSMVQRTRAHGVPWGDLAILCERTKDVQHYADLLRRSGVPTIELHRYAGETVDHVKVGTIKRAKGLEFKYVLLPGLSRTPPAAYPGEGEDAYAERVTRWRRELYVGMTRARDGLWLGYVDPA